MTRRPTWGQRLAVAAAGATITLSALAAEVPASTAGAAPASSITLSSASGEQWPCAFNPFNINDFYFTLGLVNEELYYIDPVDDAMTPWLATSYRWSHNDKTLTWQIRRGVKFSNGTPLTAADVAYTFQLIKKHPDLDVNSIDGNLRSVSQTGADQVTMEFDRPAATDFYYVADQVAIVPEASWKSVANPLTYKDADPIGTGPYTVGSCSPESITYVKNPHYWQPGKPKFDKVIVPAILTNSVANELLANGSAQWGGQFIPDIKSFYLAKNSGNRDWFPPYGLFGVFPNLTNPLLSKLAVRQALAYGINRKQVSVLGEAGEDPPANQAGVPLPYYQSWYNTRLSAKYNYSYDPAKAIKVLEAAGFKRGADGIFETKGGAQLRFTMIAVGGYSDWVADGQLIATQLAKIGIAVTNENLSNNAYQSDISDGHYQLALGNSPGRTIDGPFGMLRGLLYSGNSAPIGKPAVSNYERYSSASEDALFDRLDATTNTAAAEALVKQIEAPMLTDVPFIPVVDSVVYDEYNVNFASGWPTQSDPYASPGPTNQPDWEVVLLHLVPKG